MSFEASAWAGSQTTGSPEAKLILLLLGDMAGHEGECWVVSEALAARAEISNSRLQEILATLTARELICDVCSDPHLILLPVNDKARKLAADPERARDYFADELAWRRNARQRDSNG